MTCIKRVLLLGATGFIGTRILNLLRRRAHLRVMVLGHRNVNYRALEDIDLVVDDLKRFDLSWIERFKPDTIIHLARFRGRGRLGRTVAAHRGRRANRRLIAWLCERAPNIRVLYVSGTLMYGDQGERIVDEQTPLNPIAYAREYFAAEEPWLDAQREGLLPITIVRPPWIIGPGSWFHHHYVFPALNNGEVPLYGSGQNWMSFLDITDCAGSVLNVAERSEPGKVFNLFAPGQIVRQIEFVSALSDAMGVGVRQIDDDKFRKLDRAAWEALTFSLRASTNNEEVSCGYQFRVPNWRDMITRHLTPASSQ